MSLPLSRAAEVVKYWRKAGAAGDWFSHRPAFDEALRDRFLPLHEQATAGACDAWIDTPEGTLALLILLDQFPRNAFRDTPRMYATDPKARRIAREAEARGHMAKVDPELRLFFALPFAHSEDLADQEISVTLNRRLGQPWLSHAEDHRNIIRRFGRFPHRNPILGRETTPEEARFLAKGGFSG
ncbi:Uncharacterized conserved protein, DUF924 family [Paracoccus halophilus]|uniref:Uncharacterized conserved protein, DUF924 family n=1 Tax=Paracoccus halophilus TaxID=376733 RepID=A0A099EWI7_9RHOB|nr:DUF924 family protein [Paracoccus halophilus]KGJ02327.1 hypothetical protein IT41_17740 [Paracoccus halophilus]SFA61302.1 Uncharacterized conserved protein, DUF924 family [Paracoccus halophilus]